jgi:flagellar protein FlaI
MTVEEQNIVKKKYASYNLNAQGLKVTVDIEDRGDFVPIYSVNFPELGEATRTLLMSLRQELLNIVPIDTRRVEDEQYLKELSIKYNEAANLMIDRYLPGTPAESKTILIAYVINTMLGLGDLEPLLADNSLEEIAVNDAKSPIWVFHSKYQWCKTNITMRSDAAIYDTVQQIGRRVGRSITNLAPLMDAELPDGSRINATLFPISQKGNTITIRKFAENPWTMTALVANGTISSELAAMIWLCIQNEISILISGGTASGKTSFLNAMSIFMPANHRIISVEETKELRLPKFLHWLPMLTRQANPEGKGEILLYDLMINALRQRPDIMLVGEIRVKKDAETLFEAIHTGHAVYGTVHADNAEDTVIRMTNPPIDIPKIMLNSLGAVVSLFRHRRLGIRRVLEFGEMLQVGDVTVTDRWDIRSDTFTQINALSRLVETISLYGGYTRNEIKSDIADKVKVLQWMVKNKLLDVEVSGAVVANYYKDQNRVIKMAEDDVPFSNDLIKGL